MVNLFLTIGKDLTNIWACLSIKVGSKKNVVVLARSPFVLREHIASYNDTGKYHESVTVY